MISTAAEANKPLILYVQPTLLRHTAVSAALGVLRHLDGEAIDLEEFPTDSLGSGALAAGLEKYDAIVVRPTRGGNEIAKQAATVKTSFLKENKNLFVIGSIASDPQEKLAALALPSIKQAFHSKLKLNAESVADLVIWYALNAYRPFSVAAQGLSLSNVPRNYYDRDAELRRHVRVPGIERSTTLVNKIWLLIGMGRQVELLIPRLIAMGIDDILIYYKPDSESFSDEAWSEKLEKLARFSLEPLPIKSSHAVLGRRGERAAVSIKGFWGRTITISASDQLAPLLKSCDVASIHLPHIREGSRSTHHLIGATEIENMRPGSLLINVGRQEVWDEEAVVRVAEKRDVTLASDLLHPNCEGSPQINITRSPLIAKLAFPENVGFNPSPEGFHTKGNSIEAPAYPIRRRVMATPHIGGATKDMYAIEAEVVLGVLTELAGRYEVLRSVLPSVVEELQAAIPKKFFDREKLEKIV